MQRRLPRGKTVKDIVLRLTSFHLCRWDPGHAAKRHRCRVNISTHYSIFFKVVCYLQVKFKFYVPFLETYQDGPLTCAPMGPVERSSLSHQDCDSLPLIL
jgi:hypothetical protein